jgi:hypothetical protein
MKKLSLIIIFFYVVIIFLIQCKPTKSDVQTFNGEPEAVDKAEEMFGAIGGKEAWCNLRSLYIKAKHTEPTLDNPYDSQIWRAIDHFKMRIEQENEDFHVKGYVDEQGGTIHYLDDRDSTRTLSEEQLKEWKFDHDHNIYVLLHDIACQPERYKVEVKNQGRLAFYSDAAFLTSFELDDLKRPHIFYVPSYSGDIVGSRFTHWATHDDLVHSAGGHPLDSNFMYITEIWQPSELPFDEVFKE